MNVTPQGSHVFTVDEFTVNLAAYFWNGSCTCGTFTGCCRRLLDPRGQSSKPWRCDHIEAARSFAMDAYYPALAEAQDKIIELPVRYEPSNSDFGA